MDWCKICIYLVKNPITVVVPWGKLAVFCVALYVLLLFKVKSNIEQLKINSHKLRFIYPLEFLHETYPPKLEGCGYCKMVNGFWYYRALASVNIASALSNALTIYPCQVRVHQRWQSKLQLHTARKKEWRLATVGSSPPCGYLSTLIHTTFVGLKPTNFRSLVPCATSSATEPAAVKMYGEYS